MASRSSRPSSRIGAISSTWRSTRSVTKPGYYPYLGIAGGVIIVEALKRSGDGPTRAKLISHSKGSVISRPDCRLELALSRWAEASAMRSGRAASSRCCRRSHIGTVPSSVNKRRLRSVSLLKQCHSSARTDRFHKFGTDRRPARYLIPKSSPHMPSSRARRSHLSGRVSSLAATQRLPASRELRSALSLSNIRASVAPFPIAHR